MAGRTASGAGRSLVSAVAIGLAVLCAGALLLHLATPIELDVTALCLAGVTAALLAAALLGREVARSRTHNDKVSEELDVLAQTLLRIEGGLAALDGSGHRAKSTLNDVAGDVHSLSQVVKSLAEAMAMQDREIGAMKRGDTASYRAVLPPDESRLQPQPVPSFIPAREAAEAALSESLPATPLPGPERASEGKASILAAAALGEVDLHLQPVVGLPQRRERIYEVYPLLRNGPDAALVPSQYRPAIEAAGRLADFEAGLVAKALVFAHRLGIAGIDGLVSLQVSRSSIADRTFLRRLETLVEDHEGSARRLVIEVEQEAWPHDAAVTDVFARLRRAGVSFGLTAVKDENLNPPALARLGMRYVRLDARRLMTAIASDGPAADLATLVGALSRSGIEVVAHEVEDEVVVPELLDLGVSLAQGLAFSLPAPADAVLEQQPRRATSSVRPKGPAEAPEPDGSGPPLGSLRSFLRRAG